MGPKDIFKKTNDEWSFVKDEVIDRISGLAIQTEKGILRRKILSERQEVKELAYKVFHVGHSESTKWITELKDAIQNLEASIKDFNLKYKA